MGDKQLVFITALVFFLLNAAICFGAVVPPGHDAAAVFENGIDIVFVVVVKPENRSDVGFLFFGVICSDGSNWYVYCRNNPLCFVDPTGFFHTGLVLTGQFNFGGNRFAGSIEIRMATDMHGNNTIAIQATTSDGMPITVENPHSGPPVVHISLEGDFGIAYLVGNADNVQQLENKGKTTGASLGLIAGGQFEFSNPVDENGDIVQNRNDKNIWELQFSFSPIFPGLALGFEFHIDNDTNTTTEIIIYSTNNNNNMPDSYTESMKYY